MDPIQVCDTGMLDLGSLFFGAWVGFAAGVIYHHAKETAKRGKLARERAAAQR